MSYWVSLPYFHHFPVVLWPLLVPLQLCWVFLLALTLLVLVLTVHCYKSRTPVEWRPVQTAGSESSRLVWQPKCRRENKTIVINFWYRSTRKQTNLTQMWSIINNYWMKLSMISWIIKTEVCVICRSRRLRRITQTRGFDNSYYYTSDSLWKIWLVESIQSIHNSLWTWHDKCNICSRYCIYHVKFNVCLVTKPLGVFSSETKWLNAWLLLRVEDTAEVQQ